MLLSIDVSSRHLAGRRVSLEGQTQRSALGGLRLSDSEMRGLNPAFD